MRILVRVSGESVGTLEISKDWPDVELVADLDVMYCAQCALPDLKTTANKKTCSVACKSKFHRNGVQ